jgi:hypothetical protein
MPLDPWCPDALTAGVGAQESPWQGLFWEGDGGVLLEKALANPDKPLRISAAALLMRIGKEVCAPVHATFLSWRVP